MSDGVADLHSLIRKHSGKLNKARQEQWVEELKAMGVPSKEKALKYTRRPHRGGSALCNYSNLVAEACTILYNTSDLQSRRYLRTHSKHILSSIARVV